MAYLIMDMTGIICEESSGCCLKKKIQMMFRKSITVTNCIEDLFINEKKLIHRVFIFSK